MINRKQFYIGYRKYFVNKLTNGQVNGFERILDEWELYVSNLGGITKSTGWELGAIMPQLAYILASVYHETGTRMLPVREGYAETDAEVIRIVARMYQQGRIKRNYALPDPVTGQSYFGRGPLQLTWKDNYVKADNELGLGGELVKNPSLALDPVIGARIAVYGMYEGWFSGHPDADEGVPDRRDLWDYINPATGKKDYFEARRIVNGLDSAGKIAGYATRFEKILTEASD